MLVGFFQSLAKIGPTAAQGVFTSLEWLRRHAGLELLPLDASVVQHFRHAQVGHQPQQQKPLSVGGYGALVDVLQGDASQWVKCSAALVLRVALTGLRFAHVARASRIPAESTFWTSVWQITRGKVASRAGFKTASPTHAAPGVDLDVYIKDLIPPEQASLGNDLLPDLQIGKQGLEGECHFMAGSMPRAKFMGIASFLFGKIAEGKVTGYTFRRFLPTVAGA